MVGVLPKRRILIRYGESERNRGTTAYTTTPDHNIQSMTQGMARPSVPVQFYVSPYARTRSMLRELRQYFLRKKIVDVRKESRV
ncbi:hypothetical protein JHK85_010736 [Glycine max]|nr:hypothetical protein JHK85_010736 [Glycine max]